MPLAKLDTSRYPRTYVFNTLNSTTVQVGTVGIGQANTTITATAIMPIPTTIKVVKIAVSWLTATLANLPTFNIVYNTVQNLNAAQAYTQGNIAPQDNSYSGGITTSTAGAFLGSAASGSGTPGFPNPALTTAFPNYQQIGGLGIPTNVAVDAQPLFAADVVLNTTNFPGAHATGGGYGILIPTNYDAVYPGGPFPYGLANGMTNGANIPSVLTIRATSPTTTVTGLAVTIFHEPVTLVETVAATALLAVPGQLF